MSVETERARLEQEIDALSRGLPDEAAEVVRKADEIMAAHRELIADLEARREALDAQFGVTEQARRDAAARQRQEQREATDREMSEAGEAFLGAWDVAQQHLVAFVEAINAGLAAHARLRQAAKRRGALPHGLEPKGLVERLGSWVSTELRKINNPGPDRLPQGGTTRIGELHLPAGLVSPVPEGRAHLRTGPAPSASWRVQEEHRLGPALSRF